MEQIGVILLTSFFILLGLAGSVIPILPGPPLAWTGLLIYGWLTGFEDASVLAVVIFGVFTVLAQVIDLFAPALGAKGYKATRSGIIGAFLGVILGMIFLGPPGIFLGPLLGAFTGEYLAHRNHERALKAAWGSFVGFLIGATLKITIVLAISVYFISTLFS